MTRRCRFGVLTVMLCTLLGPAASAVARPSQQEPPPPPPVVHPDLSVTHPSANVDPKINVVPTRTHAHFPTPVIHPPIKKGDTAIVPK